MKPSLRGRLPLYLSLLAIFSAWELLYHFGLVSRTRVSHPVAIFLVLFDSVFVSRFALMMVRTLALSLIGGGIGLVLGFGIRRFNWLSQSTIRFLRVATWFPFFLLCAISYWSIGKISLLTIMGICALSLYSCYRILVMRLSVQEKGSNLLLTVCALL